ncbi:MAG: prolyl oligopeptidase family serine peptidase [Bacillota bacterium]|nr:prolyl oligopeptidase family serine peptidase [Bacillota bacterium]
MKEYTPFEYKGKTMLIDSFLVLGKRFCAQEDYDLFDININDFAKQKIEDINNDGYKNLEIFDELGREFYNTFKYFNDSESQKVFLYTEVYCKKNTQIIIHIDCSKNTKFWVNGNCISIHNSFWSEYFYVKVPLLEGKNTFLLEKYSPIDIEVFSIQLRNYEFEMGSDFKALSNLGKNIEIAPLILKNKSNYLPNEYIYRFMYLLNDINAFQQQYQVEILKDDGQILQTFTSVVNQVNEINLKSLEINSYHITIQCRFIDFKNNEKILRHKIIIKDFQDKAEKIKKKAKDLLEICSAEESIQILGRLQQQEKLSQSWDIIGYYNLIVDNEKFFDTVNIAKYQAGFYKSPGDHEFFIHSELDDSYVKVKSRVPQNYNTEHYYPVFICLMSGNVECFGEFIELDKLNEPILCFDVSGRGYTGGSYIGEASILEIITWIKNNYSIDEDRLYIIGQSNGGFATYSLAQNHPGLSAAIFPMISFPNVDILKNISNIPIYQCVSPKDYIFHGRENVVKNKLSKFSNYHQYNFKEFIHSQFRPYIAHPIVLNELLKTKRNAYPNQVIFKTQRNRHLEGYYLKLHGIKDNCKSATIKCDIISPQLIEIKISGAKGFTIKIPPQINRKKFHIKINRKTFEFTDCYQNELMFIHKNDWEQTNSEPKIDYRKGTGLLDVYLDKMRIVISDYPSECEQNLAKKFAKPVSSGFDPEIHVNYPIFYASDVPKNIFDNNLILIDINNSNSFVKEIKNDLIVKYNEKGYEYNGETVTDEYVIMQVIPNPTDNNLSILVVSTNNEDLLKKHVLLRKVTIPTYCYGLHEFWNKEVLIYRDGKYETISFNM